MDNKAKVRYAPKVIAIIAFILTFSMLSIAFTADIVLFAEYIINFVFGIIASAFMFILFLMLMIVSLVLIFGFYLLETYGFWPITWTENTFHEILGDAVITSEQIMAFTIIRIIILVVCFAAIILGILSLRMDKRKEKIGSKPEGIRFKAFARLAIIFSMYGILVGIGMLAIIKMV